VTSGKSKVGVGVIVGVGEIVGVGVMVGVLVWVRVGVAVAVGMREGVGESVGVKLAVKEAVGVELEGVVLSALQAERMNREGKMNQDNNFILDGEYSCIYSINDEQTPS
jgi:acyl-[acyl carrier protein]--UDP-N-acetylglucosamine O-acyltransferase